MLQASKLIPQGQGLAPVLVRRAAHLELDWDVRQKSRFDATASNGRTVGVFLPRGSVVRGGDVLITQDGSLIRVVAAPQTVLKITACTAHDHHHEHSGAFDLMRAAYHLGNRHVPIELQPDHLKIEPDHVLADMLRAMHLTVAEVREPFEPEGGAYGQQHAGGHGHAHGDQTHTHGHDHHAHGHHAHGHDHAAGHGHG
ncbi:MAG: urease accessory protein UreE [Hydrogenophaga sp.]|uniref:urease accessory protein UreE n=1 Tax=Hydrogenophaga aromaticivorans TaxID=2610898 RepID=UPI001B37975C|nr:urease accessory protein UreE [Hydrogenophaga aromaticivorans]MBQ0920289.1 urease accessory protein UreE [Hydrogenophaga aromaticivorans]MBW8317045.1 urease accessory protein UreE [Hydrogenophaga sp.]MBW8467780.1 urease accessory protein UreE [Thiobacillus sp.]MDO9290000.1 urease accessory protein UreE [Hydrogenophaga sp.]